ncbi:DUF4238 domain-containing protein [Rhizobium leguminosarum]|uniref:DUF4238 domain-containing protein n=1 Tax=Rhizobium TaxID=379 RepID=UPI0013BA4372|nr:DUF4238 domain-containing protein [Rhizobium leguminosarum]MBY5428245.1 DUF4238 domain-containing protein [Rhizobium leguminosarum]NEK45458.1 DUF4238 domain-containing protein [Rhizobium leguminosarum]NKL20755.1 DUF4238 domain-containing protein [Rhizobium leguminosarum bv. viciae]NKL57814.1 DUF4238 domain-containing protein [Rhizobium leguminosarum bv. viciae]
MPRNGSHKSQHFVPKSYLSAWCDPNTPSGMQPYVWTFDRSGGSGRKRAPQNLFTETDIYTIFMPDGSRDLRLELELSKLEKGLKTIVKDFVAQYRPLPQPQQSRLTAFIAAMHGRTLQARDIQRTLWQDTLDLAEREERELVTLSASEQERVAAVADRPANSQVKLGNLRRAVASPMQFLLPGAIAEGLPLLSQMTITIMCSDEPCFITSDSPVTWFDPTVARDKFLTHKSSLSDPGIEVAMPLSPRHTIMLHHPMTPFVKPARYVRVSTATIAALNRRTAHYADKALVSWRDGFDPTWLIVPPTM